MNRRRLLATLSVGSVGVVSGCAGILSDNSKTSSDNEDKSSEPETEQLESAEEEKTDSDYSPEPRYVVAEDGSGDYETVSEAVQVAQDGDVIGLKPGEYQWNATIKENKNTFNEFDAELTFVGKESSSTVLTVSPGGTSSFSAGNKNPQFHALSVTLTDSVDWTARQTYAGGGDGSVRPVKFNKCQVSGTIRGSFHANNTKFISNVAPTEGVIRDCSFQGAVRVGEATIERSKLNNGAIDVSGCRLTECTIFENSDDTAVRMTGDGEIRHCEIRGQVQNSGGTWRANRFITDSGSFNFFIDDAGPNMMWGNIFDGADVRFSGSVTMYNEDRDIGNFYSEWDAASDDNGDGISELPRSIPGESDTSDQYPLVNKDIASYGLKPEDVPFYDPTRE